MSDSLDLLAEIMHPREWSHDFSLCEIVNRLKNFIEKMIGQDERLSRAKIVGEYHLETVYDLAVFQNRRLSDGSVLPGKFARTSWLFNCVHEEREEHDDEDDDSDEVNVTQTQRVLLVTQSCLLILQSLPNFPRLAQLQFWATISSIERMKRNLNCPSLMSIKWRSYFSEDMDHNTVLRIGQKKSDTDAFIAMIRDRMKRMGLESRRNVESKIQESDVSLGSAARLDIIRILDAIDRHEEVIAAGELDIDTIQGLTALYQKGIEYYSAFDNVMFTDLLYRMQSLL